MQRRTAVIDLFIPLDIGELCTFTIHYCTLLYSPTGSRIQDVLDSGTTPFA